jgi:diguanylate cyclase (GGDEF)-like protein
MPLFLLEEPPETTTQALIAALDLVDFGITLLDPALRFRFINRIQIEMWNLPLSLFDAGTSFRAVLEHVASDGMYPLPADEIAAYIEKREAQVRGGSSFIDDIDLADGRRFSLRCILTPDGGRMLSYTDVTHNKRELDRQRQEREAAERLGVELRFSNESLESQAVYLASLAEVADEAARKADEAKRRLEHEMAERAVLERELRRMATTDALTTALNRAQLMALGQRELDRVRVLEQDLAVLMLDIDHFKSINDRYGHAGGDAALRHIVELMRRGVRQIDLVGRLGGEEFSVVLPAITPQAALLVGDRLRATIAASPFMYEGQTINVTTSVGVAMARPSDPGLEQVLARADAALYTAKRDGRNCLRSADPPIAA